MAQSNGNPTTEEIIDNLEDMLNDRISQEPTAPQVFPQSVSLPVMAHMQAPTAPSPTPAEAYIRIIEEPAERVTRFRYKCEDRFATPIAGKNSDAQKCKTYPTIEIVGYHGKKVVVVSCVTREKPYRQHPHWLVSKDDSNLCKKGVYRIMLPPEQNTLELQKVGIQCVKKNEVLSSLTERQNMKVDPFKAKFDHKNDIASINMYELRLCYQVFLPDAKNDFRIPLNPVVSSPIIGKSKEPLIARLCSCAAKVTGGDEIIMLCENINKNDIRVRFFETNEQNDVIWEADAEFQKTDIYKQMAIAFRTPRYRDPDVTHSVFVYLQLVRPTDMATSDPVAFEYYPNPDSLTQHRRLEAHKAVESVKRKLLNSDMLDQKLKQPKKQSPVPVPVPAMQLPQMGGYDPYIKAENIAFDMGAASPYNNNVSYPASPSSCSTADSYSPIQPNGQPLQVLHQLQPLQMPQQHQQMPLQLQQHQQLQQPLPVQPQNPSNLAFSMATPQTNPQWKGTAFSGGSITPINTNANFANGISSSNPFSPTWNISNNISLNNDINDINEFDQYNQNNNNNLMNTANSSSSYHKQQFLVQEQQQEELAPVESMSDIIRGLDALIQPFDNMEVDPSQSSQTKQF
ncbi:dorsal-related immunity factor Dif isoform X2 [Scaptodrosophila lebanonensis]|uniref:Dorsal-related immunity factor Dif isoform X2 n=1 Tax=Drosophila lebanonensis TaxID=7225 RepID=A0A6J2U624_DROLE|nr:dorsal-related immunity factor Dif isoform X2 [Scaptodrosophila lebanonensis]